MLLIMLVEPHHLPVPRDVEIVQNFGSERVITNIQLNGQVGKTHTGDSMYLEAAPEAFVRWLASHGDVLVTTNPMMGDWDFMHIKADVLKAVEEGKEIPLPVKAKEVVREPAPAKELTSFAKGPRRLWAKLFANRKTEAP